MLHSLSLPLPSLRHQLCASSYTPIDAATNNNNNNTRTKLQGALLHHSMAMARSSSSTAATATAATAVVFLAVMLCVGSCHGEQLVAMTHPAPAGASSTLGSKLGSTLVGSLDANLAATSKYYISYGSLDANRAPCPAGAGRSYYTQNCQGSGDVQPYVRSCNQITRCARG